MAQSEKKKTQKTQNEETCFLSVKEAGASNTEKMLRFALDYCRASPNIILKDQKQVCFSWRNAKTNFKVEYEKFNSILTTMPVSKTNVDLEDDFAREAFIGALLHVSRCGLVAPFQDLSILNTQKQLIKIVPFYSCGSLRDLIHKTSPKDTNQRKYEKKGDSLSKAQITNFSKQILEALFHFHSKGWYHLHLHSGNILLNETNRVFISDIEKTINNANIRNDEFYSIAFENISKDYFTSHFFDYNSSELNEAFASKFNIFEKIDVISFGRIVYEMATGRELNAPTPDDIEYDDMDDEISEMLKRIFKRKRKNDAEDFVTAKTLLELQLFGSEEMQQVEWGNSGEFDYIKGKLFDQNKFIREKLKSLFVK